MTQGRFAKWITLAVQNCYYPGRGWGSEICKLVGGQGSVRLRGGPEEFANVGADPIARQILLTVDAGRRWSRPVAGYCAYCPASGGSRRCRRAIRLPQG